MTNRTALIARAAEILGTRTYSVSLDSPEHVSFSVEGSTIAVVRSLVRGMVDQLIAEGYPEVVFGAPIRGAGTWFASTVHVKVGE